MKKRVLFLLIILTFTINIFSQSLEKIIIAQSQAQANSDLAREIIEIYTEAYRRIGFEVEFQTYPDIRSLVLVDNGVVAGDFGRVAGVLDNYTNLRRVNISLLGVYIHVYYSDSLFVPNSWESLTGKGYKIGYRSGVNLVTRRLENENLIAVNSVESGFSMLKSGRLDYFVDLQSAVNESSVYTQVTENSIKKSPLLEEIMIYHLLNKKYERIIPALEKSILEVIKEREFKIGE